MSSRLFQTIREQRGLAYAVFSGVSSYRDTGMLSVYAGCAAESVPEVVQLVDRNCAPCAPTSSVTRNCVGQRIT